YLLKSESGIYDFLTGDISDLSAEAELYYSDEFRKLRVVSGSGFNIGLRVSSDMDLLEMDFNYADMDADELQSLFRSLRVRKKYYRMQDGSFINLQDDGFEHLMDILDNLGVSSKNIGRSGIRLSKSNAFYLNDALDKCGFNVERNSDFVKLIDNIRNAENEVFELPDGINATLRGYQEVGYRWLMTLAKNCLGGILADDMGLGKTLQTIVYMKAVKQRTSGGDNPAHFLIVCPSSIVYNWMDEISNFCPDMKAVVVTGAPPDRKALIESYADYDVVITSYPLMRRDVALYRKILFETIFLDEAQFIKNAASLNAQSVKLLRAEHRFALTGTPIENSLSELWSIFDFIMPNFLMAHSRFAARYEKPIIAGDTEVLESLNTRIRPFIMRRMKKDVLKELPGKLEEKMIATMTEEQKKVYLSYLSQIRTDLFGEINQNGIEKSQIKILAALTRLRQICCHPGTCIENYNGGSGKLELLMTQLDNAIANGHRTLVFSQFTSMLEIIRKELDTREIKYFYLDGQTDPEDRLDMAKRFNAGEC
ncbi:MAG: SNF2 helicase associated domain-containing protein, partial [Lachnospiraceae bacterium]|nr:SNF2 helicase associated domain-containing protein [Lachnospiraceae bacterium]